jgi:acetyltransferase-like isoleucine patch superfamily enzyme
MLNPAMVRKARKALAYLIALTPLNALRIALYKGLMGYRIDAQCKLGLGVVIAVDAFDLGAGSTIGRNTVFMGPITVRIGKNVSIGKSNQFICGNSVADPRLAHMNYSRMLILGDDSLINQDHLFDLLGRIEIGQGTWVAGFQSQFLTHGAGVMDRDIAIGQRSFIGSAARFTPGSGIGDDVIVAMSATVTKVIPESGVVVGGVPARVLRARDEGDAFRFEKTW